MAEEPSQFSGFKGQVGVPLSPERQIIVREAAGKILQILNDSEEAAPDVIGTVLLSMFMSQPKPVEAFNLITLNVASGIRTILTPTQGSTS